MAKGYYLGLDQGTTGTTALLLDESWGVVGKGYAGHTRKSLGDGRTEQNPKMLWNAALKAVRRALVSAGVSAGQIICMGIDNQGESCMIWDRITGEPLQDAILWQDRRTEAEANYWRQERGAWIKARTGLVADPYFSATKLQWLLNKAPDAREKAKAGKLAAGTLDTWLMWKLSGGKVYKTDVSTASRTMLCNIYSGDWDEELLEMFDIPLGILPEICDSAGLFGKTSPTAFFGSKIWISGSAVDQQAALLGQGCLKPGAVKTTYGTGCFLMMNVGDKPVFSNHGLLTTVAWRLGGKIDYALDGGIYTAGSAVSWLRDRMKLIRRVEDTEKMARLAGSGHGLYFVPAFNGLAAPHWDSHARGTILGLSSDTTREQLVRATLESIAFQVKDNLDIMEQDTGFSIPLVRVDGGMVENRFLMEFQADLLGLPVDVPEITETTALGAAYLAALGNGRYSRPEELAGFCKISHRYEPRMPNEQRQELLYNWHRAVERSKEWLQEG